MRVGSATPRITRSGRDLGIRTEWVWVKEEEPTRWGLQADFPERRARPNVDLVEAAEFHLPRIRMLYKRFEDKQLVMLLELPALRVYATRITSSKLT